MTGDTEQQAPGLDWDAASRKMIEQEQEVPEVELPKCDLTWTRACPRAIALGSEVVKVERQLAAAQEHSRLLDDQLRRTQGYEANMAGEIAALKARLNKSARVCTEAVEEIFELKQQLADMTADYLRRHKDAADRSEEVLTLRIEIAALKQRLEEAEQMVNAKSGLLMNIADTLRARGFVTPSHLDERVIAMAQTLDQIKAAARQLVDACPSGDGLRYFHAGPQVIALRAAIAAEPPGGQQEQGHG